MDDGFHEIIADLYDSRHVGVVIVQNMLDAESLRQIRNVLETKVEHFYPLQFGNVTRWDLAEEDFRKYPVLELGRKEFRRMVNEISFVTRLNPVYQEKFSIMFYPEGSSGVEPHRDSEHSVNCVAIFVIKGNNTFFVAKDRACKEVTEFPTRSGDVILMRGPRGIGDILSRPIHYVSEVTRSRYVMICRHINLDGLKS